MLAFVRKSLRSWAAVAILFLVLVAIVVTGFGTDGFGGLGSLGGGGNAGEALATRRRRAGHGERGQRPGQPRSSPGRAQQQPTLDMATFLAAGRLRPDARPADRSARRSGIMPPSAGLVVSDADGRPRDRQHPRLPQLRRPVRPERLPAALQSQNMTEARLRDDIARSLMQRQLLAPGRARRARAAGRGARICLPAARAAARQRSAWCRRRRFAAGIEPTDAELAAFYQQQPRALHRCPSGG